MDIEINPKQRNTEGGLRRAIHLVDVHKLIPTQDRGKFRNRTIKFLKKNWSNYGMDIPITCYKDENGYVYIIDGHHRARVAGIYGGKVKCFFVSKPIDWSMDNALYCAATYGIVITDALKLDYEM